MGWKDLLQTTDQSMVLPWVGGRSLQTDGRAWTLDGGSPLEHGWYAFRIFARTARVAGLAEGPATLGHLVRGYLVGDRLFPDGARVDPNPRLIVRQSERVHLIEAGLERFARVVAGRTHESGSLIFQGPELPLGPEDEVVRAWVDRAETLDRIRGVPPALDAAFRMLTWRRKEAERLRAVAEQHRIALEQARLREQRRQAVLEKLGDGAGRRAVAEDDFSEAAKAALSVGGAQWLDDRPAHGRGERVVQFRLDGRRFECTCDHRTLRIIDAGICLVDHETGEKGDAYFTLESLPAVIRQADREGRLVVFRHVDD